jgi:hypothetical protein
MSEREEVTPGTDFFHFSLITPEHYKGKLLHNGISLTL